MTSRANLAVFRRVAAESLFWCLLSGAFLWGYLTIATVSIDAAIDHVRIFGVSVLGLYLSRLLVVAVPVQNIRRFGQAALTLGFLTFWSGFYAMVLVGLHYWGEVITLKIFAVYVGQLDTLLSTLDISRPLFIVVIGVLLALGFTVCYWIHRDHWASAMVQSVGWRPFVIPYLGLSGIFVAEIFSFNFRLASPSNEPLALALRERGLPTEQAIEFDGPKGKRIQNAASEAREKYITTQDPLKANVILIVVDALRDDHLSLNGYPRSTTPHLQYWMARTGGMTLGQARASCASSVCGISSIITSRFSHEQTTKAMTLHEVFARHGWKTHLALSGDHTNFYGLRQRYGQVDSYIDGSNVSPAMLNDDRFVVDAVKSLDPSALEPGFLHLHLKSSHILGRRFFPAGRYGPSSNYSNPLFKVNSDHLQRAINYYDEGVVQADDVIHQILLALEVNGVLDRALVVITGDHGEHLGEHGRFSHANGLLEPVLRIPWIMLPFGVVLPPPEIHRRRHQVDIAPTILDVLRMPVPSGWSGVSIFSSGSSPEFSYLRQGAEVGLVDHRDPKVDYKYIMQPPPGGERVTNLTDDSKEELEAIVSEDLVKEWRDLLLPQLLSVMKDND